jgi:hypothetical protein
MSQVEREGLVQAIDRLHMFLPDLTGYAPVPGSDGRRLDPWRGGPCSGAGSADQVIDFFLG